MFDDRFLDVLDGDGRLVDAEHARGFAWGGADATGELREIVRRVQNAHGLAPAAAVTRSFQSGMMLFSGQPVWQKGTPQSMQRAAWFCTFSLGKRLVNFKPVVDALGDRPPRRQLACILHENR